MDEPIKYFRLFDFSDAALAKLVLKLDALHDLASEGHITEATNVHPADVIGYLEEIIYVARETIGEIEKHEYYKHWLAGLREHQRKQEYDA